MEKVVKERMQELEQAILSSESEPSRLNKISRYLLLASQAIVQIVEEMRNDPEMKQRENLVACLLSYIEYAVLSSREANTQKAEPADTTPGPVVTYKGKAIDLVELGMGIWLSEDVHVDGKPATQKFIRQALEMLFGVSLAQWDSRVQELKRRTKDHRLSKYNEITRRLDAYLDQLSDDRPKRYSF
ncbi:hypothetical protein [Puia dinghuensis]|uniref:Uncharacterized protein n=1 Tax=Puia dinghuensis TaxID=1792502 RepID=A0A8J2XWG8_9BACT|nr:hypothetical protein [Puia dinghuensis]GGB23843.1 hypothetical protein GCM10011511_54660 [Puia dinghuensis]